MAQTNVMCPECGTEQTSAYGYAPAQTVRCRRCDATFKVPGAKRVAAVAADEEDADEQPRSKQWMFGAVAVLLLLGLAVVGAVRYVEQQRERAEEEQLAAEMARDDAERQAARAARAPRPFPAKGTPPPNPFFAPPREPSPKETKEAIARLSKRLVGVWRADGPAPREVEYRAEGTFRDGPLEGTWKAVGVNGPKVLKLERSAGRSPVRVTFEGDELLHDGEEPGVSAVLRKK